MVLTVFFTGSTGYIGGAVLHLLLKGETKYNIRALVRSQEKADKLAAIGVTPVVGSLDDVDLLKREAYNADIIFQNAHADHLVGTKALVEGLEAKFKETGKKAKFIHTSGSGIVVVQTRGNEGTPIVYRDDDAAQVASIPVTNLHRDVDTYLLDHAAAYDLVIVTPTTVYGIGYGVEGVSHPISIQFPRAISAALRFKQPQRIGKGLNVWSCVHINDLADLYILLLDKLLKGELSDPALQGYYFVENGEYQQNDAQDEIGRLLVQKGVTADAAVNELATDEDIVRVYGHLFGGTCSRVKAVKARHIGWSPKYEGDAWKQGLAQDFEYLLAQQNANAQSS